MTPVTPVLEPSSQTPRAPRCLAKTGRLVGFLTDLPLKHIYSARDYLCLRPPARLVGTDSSFLSRKAGSPSSGHLAWTSKAKCSRRKASARNFRHSPNAGAVYISYAAYAPSARGTDRAIAVPRIDHRRRQSLLGPAASEWSFDRCGLKESTYASTRSC